MNPLSFRDLRRIVRDGIITDVTDDMINGTSIDVTLGENILVEDLANCTVDVAARQPLRLLPIRLNSPYTLQPGEFILAQTRQKFNLPLYMSAEYKLKSSLGRVGLEHLNAGWCDPGWNGSVLTLELKNMTRYHRLTLTAGMPIGQMVFFQHDRVPLVNSYATRGRYNQDDIVKGIKP